MADCGQNTLFFGYLLRNESYCKEIVAQRHVGVRWEFLADYKSVAEVGEEIVVILKVN